MTKRTHASVTEELCACNYLQHAVDHPRNPITFDPQTSEYQFSYGGAKLVIYHCPFCGGAAPESKRHLLFARIPPEEEQRLAKLLDGIETIEQSHEELGTPDFEGTSRSEHPENDDAGPRIHHHREIRYHNLSDVADVWITERPDGKIFWQLQGRYIGAKKPAPKQEDTLRGKRPWWRFW